MKELLHTKLLRNLEEEVVDSFSFDALDLSRGHPRIVLNHRNDLSES